MSRVPTETKSRILLSARSLFSNYGFTATSLDDILDATGITKGAFYHYFRSKDHLCQQILQDVIAEYQSLFETVDKQRPASEQLQQWLMMLMEKNLSGRWLNCRLITRLSVQMQQIGPQLQNQLIDFWRWYEGIFENWLAQCNLSSQQAKLSAQALVSVIFGTISLEKSFPGQYSIADIIQHQLQLILHNG
jgi:AcrR family transcriptional regulator